MDLGLGSLPEKFEEYYGKPLTKLALGLIGLALCLKCSISIYHDLRELFASGLLGQIFDGLVITCFLWQLLIAIDKYWQANSMVNAEKVVISPQNIDLAFLRTKVAWLEEQLGIAEEEKALLERNIIALKAAKAANRNVSRITAAANSARRSKPKSRRANSG
jgi:hypothetical protein